MDMNDMILVSVDDHLCEPPDMFDQEPPLSRDQTITGIINLFCIFSCISHAL